jgi:cobalt/nickel transport system permease protein
MKKKVILLSVAIIALIAPNSVFGMHISEGFLSPAWAITWFAISTPFVVYGLFTIKKSAAQDSRAKLYMGIAGGYVFVLSAIKLPSVAGSCSHLTGTGLGTVLFGPGAMAIIGLIVLLFQALLLAHGGISTLGANVFSMAIAGPIVAYAVFHGCKKMKLPLPVAIFMAAFWGDLFTYVVTSGQLALAYPDSSGGVYVSFLKFASMFAITQLPLAVLEGFITVYTYKLIQKVEKVS